ncbi:MAG: hypothetical protein ABIJ84_02840 [bacterium]
MNNQKGFIASFIAILILAFMLALAMSISSVILTRHEISENAVKAAQSYYAAEAGIEDSLLRLKETPQMPALNYTIDIDGFTAVVQIPSLIAGSRAIVSQGDFFNRIKKVQAVYALDAEGVSFYYGAQIGAGGLQMANSSRVNGNIFSSGNVTGSGSATIDNDVIIAGNGNNISGMYVKGNVLAYSCSNSTIDGNLTYVLGGTNNCTVGGTTSVQSGEIASQPLPISQIQIDSWKSDAGAGGTIGSVNLSGTQTMSLGPKKIAGDLSISNSAVLTLTGTVYVTGNITISNSARIKLDSSYGALGGVILSDGTITPSNYSAFEGSGQASSYLLVLSTNISNSAITVSNSATGAIFYASAGGIIVSNNFSAREVTGYKLTMSNNATINYESGLADVFFSSGPTGGWSVSSWKEIE